ncbi:trypsin-like peptidase domain-containing protein [Nakamurella leprariae]|uniref:Trypsin-like peptidase domain-containing protein n=1 Tax=Nakamurella leprariae TaxID=2803911 RepID=A0A938YJM7_9ACTN|nr:trypsin-like peptidase domain-containing protein [Nakamurella leprariae]MBM9469507.1 trypsin-like peptidase domain-containing protein [Nakamurella leprariae]
MTGAELGTATGFLLVIDGHLDLVSNWHVFAGRSVYDGKHIHHSGATPVALTLHMPVDLAGFNVKAFRLPLVAEDGTTPTWREHPTLGRTADVAALRLGTVELLAPLANLALGLESDIEVGLRVTDRLSIVGYPCGLAGAGELPVWTQGTIATEPDLNHGRLPRFLIDAKTREGQSGSPVVIHQSTLNNVRRSPDGPMAEVTYTKPRTLFVGVYSGRVNVDVELGFVWRKSLVKDVVSHDARPKSL